MSSGESGRELGKATNNEGVQVREMKRGGLLPFLVVLAVIAGLVGTILAELVLPASAGPPPLTPPEPVAKALLVAKSAVSFVNIILACTLLVIYMGIYREIRSGFTLGLAITMLVLLLYAVTSNPLLHYLFGYRAQGLGPFVLIPDLMTTTALLALVCITVE